MNLNLFLFYFACILNLFNYMPKLLATPIIGGDTDLQHQFKSHVSIHAIIDSQYAYICGGTIIHERYILTAAHCFMVKKLGARPIRMTIEENIPKIIAGTNQRNEGIERDVVKVFIPTMFDQSETRNYADVATVKLRDDLGVAQHEDTMKITHLGSLAPNEELNKLAMFTGFGYYQMEEENGKFRPIEEYSDINRFLIVMMTGKEHCTNFPAVICARSATSKTGVHAASVGDGGAGLIYASRVVGILSYSTMDPNLKHIMKFTRVWEFKLYIDRAMNENADHYYMHIIEERSKRDSRPPHYRKFGHEGASSSKQSYSDFP